MPFLALLASSLVLGLAVGRAWALLLPQLAFGLVVGVALADEVGHDLADSLIGAVALDLLATLLVLVGVVARARRRAGAH